MDVGGVLNQVACFKVCVHESLLAGVRRGGQDLSGVRVGDLGLRLPHLFSPHLVKERVVKSICGGDPFVRVQFKNSAQEIDSVSSELVGQLKDLDQAVFSFRDVGSSKLFELF
jgi:hypothetical protein